MHCRKKWKTLQRIPGTRSIPSEVVRFCCIAGIERLRAWNPAPTLLGAIKSANALILRDKLQCESMELLERAGDRVHWYIEKGAYDEAISFVAELRSYFDEVPDSFWKEYVVTEIDRKFVEWLDIIDAARKES